MKSDKDIGLSIIQWHHPPTQHNNPPDTICLLLWFIAAVLVVVVLAVYYMNKNKAQEPSGLLYTQSMPETAGCMYVLYSV